MKCSRCQQDNPVPDARFCPWCGAPVKDVEKSGPAAASYAEVTSALTEALEQQTATAEVLKVISRSTFELQPVLDTLIENAAKLCDATPQGAIFRFDGEVFRTWALYGGSPEYREYAWGFEIRPGRGSATGRVALEQRPVHILDVLNDPEYEFAEAQRRAGYRTILGIPMFRQGLLIGAFFIYRTDARAFTEKQIDLVTTFADQAVIAIENVRLFNELEARNRDLTATSEVLKVISSSPTDVQPVFDAIVESASRLCEAEFSAVARLERDLLHLAAISNMSPAETEAYRSLFPRPPRRDFIIGRAFVDARPVHVEDVLLDP